MFLKSHRAVIAISLWVVMGVPAAAQTRIVCIGDSITQSSSTHRSYRYNLWTKLLDAGFMTGW